MHRREPRQVEACVFADLSGYTRMTEESGDEVAAQVSLKLAEVVSEIASRHRGDVVKMLGDGVHFHFKDPDDAVTASLEIVDAVAPAGLPPAHIGVNAGPIDLRRGRLLRPHGEHRGAHRLASGSRPGLRRRGRPASRHADRVPPRREVGAFELKGIAQPVTLFEAIPDDAGRMTTSPPSDRRWRIRAERQRVVWSLDNVRVDPRLENATIRAVGARRSSVVRRPLHGGVLHFPGAARVDESRRRKEVFEMIEEFGEGVGVRSWASILDDKTREQAEKTALLPILTEPIALMADAHLGLWGHHRFGDPDRVRGDPVRGGRRYRLRHGRQEDRSVARSGRRDRRGVGPELRGLDPGRHGQGTGRASPSAAKRVDGGQHAAGDPREPAAGAGAARIAGLGQPLHRARDRSGRRDVDPAALRVPGTGQQARDPAHQGRDGPARAARDRARGPGAGVAAEQHAGVRRLHRGPPVGAGFRPGEPAAVARGRPRRRSTGRSASSVGPSTRSTATTTTPSSRSTMGSGCG